VKTTRKTVVRLKLRSKMTDSAHVMWTVLIYSATYSSTVIVRVFLCCVASAVMIVDAVVLRSNVSYISSGVAFVYPIACPAIFTFFEQEQPIPGLRLACPLTVAAATMIALYFCDNRSRVDALSVVASHPVSLTATQSHSNIVQEIVTSNQALNSIETNSESTAGPCPEPSNRANNEASDRKRSKIVASENALLPLSRRRRQQTASERIAFSLYAADKAEKDRIEQAAFAREEQAASDMQIRNAERKRALAERTAVADAVRAAAQAVENAKVALSQAMDCVRQAGMKRRRAGDQAKMSGTTENIEEFDRCVEVVAVTEMREQAALNSVNASQARLRDLREQLAQMPGAP
jgi:hypothetical protein